MTHTETEAFLTWLGGEPMGDKLLAICRWWDETREGYIPDETYEAILADLED